MSKLLKIFIITCFTACLSNKESSFIDVNSINQPPDILEQVQEMASMMEKKKIDHAIGFNFLNDSFQNIEDPSLSHIKSTSQIINKFADILLEIPGNPIENFILFLGKTPETNLENQLNQIFQDDLVSEQSAKLDQLIIFYLISMEAQNDLSHSEKTLLKQMVSDYFFKRIHLEAASNSEKTLLFIQYSPLHDLVEENSLLEMMSPTLSGLKLTKNHPQNAHQAMLTLLKQIQKTEQLSFSITTNFIKSALTNSKWILRETKKENALGLEQVLQSLNYTHLLFDRAHDVVNIDKNDWIILNDLRFQILIEEAQDLLLKEIEKKYMTNISWTRNHHPLTSMTIASALDRSRNQQKLIKLFHSVNMEEYPKFKDSFERQLLRRGVSHQKASNNTNGFHLNYLQETYRFYSKRFFLEMGYGQKDEILIDPNDHRVEIYQKLRETLVNILNLREGLDQSLHISPSLLSNRNEKSSLSDLTYLSQYVHHADLITSDICRYNENKIVSLPAGIYFSKDHLVLNCPHNTIRFHPFSLIFAPEKNVQITAKGLINSWIETSGFNGKTIAYSEEHNSSTPPVQRRRKARPYIHITDSNERIEKDQDYTIYSVDKGDHPPKQASGNSGGNAGLIKIQVEQAYLSGGLFISNGGNGADGARGFDVPESMIVQGRYRPLQLKEGRDGIRINYQGCQRNRLGEPNCNLGPNLIGTTTHTPQTVIHHLLAGRGGDGGHGGNTIIPRFNSIEIEGVLIMATPGIAGSGGNAGLGYQQSQRSGEKGSRGEVILIDSLDI